MSRFKILWIDDQPDKCKKERRAIKRIIGDLGFEADIDSESDISPQSLNNPDGILYRKIRGRDIDLFIIDYNLKNNVLGDDVISEIRKENEIYSDIIFYSSMYSDLVEKVKKSYDTPDAINYLDGVYIAPLGDFFEEKVERVIRKIIKSWYNIHSIRGIILSKASKFEQMVSEIIEMAYQPCLKEIKEKLVTKGENVKKSTQQKWDAVAKKEDPVPSILRDPISFNWTVKQILFFEMDKQNVITLETKKELKDIFKLRNDFAHNPIHLVDGVLELRTPDGVEEYTEKEVEEIRQKLMIIENDLQAILEQLKTNDHVGDLMSV